jgi:hypothetical protein
MQCPTPEGNHVSIGGESHFRKDAAGGRQFPAATFGSPRRATLIETGGKRPLHLVTRCEVGSYRLPLRRGNRYFRAASSKPPRMSPLASTIRRVSRSPSKSHASSTATTKLPLSIKVTVDTSPSLIAL